jgi:hypothetical protein
MIGLLIIAAALTAAPSDVDAARTDYRAHGSDPALRYLTLGAVPKGKQGQWAAVLAYQVPAASRAELLDRQIPQPVPRSTAYRIDLESLQWDWRDWNAVLAKYPYAYNDPYRPLLTVRGDWLVKQLADTRDSDAYYRLLYGGKRIPKTDAEFLAFWGFDPKQQVGQSFGWVETKSQVGLQGTRLAEHFNARGQSLWRTKDVNQVTRGSDPLEALDGNFKHDGRELIAQVAKTSLYRQSRGASQVYLLANGQGKVVNEAPVRLVEDHKRTLGQTAIINNASCVGCHEQGMQLPTENGVREALRAGELLYAYSKGKQEQLESFHLTDAGRRLQRNNEDFATFVEACNGMKPDANARLYGEMLNDYRADLDLERAAGELYTTPENLKLAIAYASANKVLVGSRVAGLAHGKLVGRDTWEQEYLGVQKMLEVWDAK